MTNQPDATPAKGWVMYDADCGICRLLAARVHDVLERRGIALVPLQEPWVVERLRLREEELLRDVHLLFIDGGQRTGADVYRYFMRRVWWLLPFYALSVTPGLKAVFDAAYRWFADNRHLISRTCGVASKG